MVKAIWEFGSLDRGTTQTPGLINLDLRTLAEGKSPRLISVLGAQLARNIFLLRGARQRGGR